jgi:hypothetical protein
LGGTTTEVTRRPVRLLQRNGAVVAEVVDVVVKHGFDTPTMPVRLLQRNGAVVAEGDECDCSAPTRPILGRAGGLEILVEFPEPLLVRFDSLLAIALAVSQTKLKKLLEVGIVNVNGPGRTSTLRIWSSVTVAVRANI